MGWLQIWVRPEFEVFNRYLYYLEFGAFDCKVGYEEAIFIASQIKHQLGGLSTE